MTATLIAGLPASGKTHLARQIAAETGASLFDDPTPLDLPSISAALKAGKDVVVTDPSFCAENVRRLAQTLFESYGAEVRWIFFENDYRACCRNAARRDDGRDVKATLLFHRNTYEVPEGADVRPVWSEHDLGKEPQ